MQNGKNFAHTDGDTLSLFKYLGEKKKQQVVIEQKYFTTNTR